MKARWFLLLVLLAAPAAAEETIIKSGRMELVNQGESVVFTGGVKLNRGNDQMQSNRMTTNKKRDKVKAEGNVRLFRRVSSTETWEGYGETGIYNTQGGSGTLTGLGTKKAHIVHTEILSSTTSRVVHLYANRIDFYRDIKRALATGAVEGHTVDPVKGDKYDFWADKAEFDGGKKEIILSIVNKQPVVTQTNGPAKKRIKGDKIIYASEAKRVISEGNAEAVFQDEEKKKKK